MNCLLQEAVFLLGQPKPPQSRRKRFDFLEAFGVTNSNGSSTQGQEGLTSSPFIPDNTPLKPLAWIRELLLFSPP
jgi:hypothetical protein